MGRISTGIGLVSGINSGQLIEQLMSLEARPKQLIETRLAELNQRKLAYVDLSTRLTGLRMTASALKRASTFQNTQATSSNEGVITATTTSGAARGTYQFQVARLVASQQAVTGGFAAANSRVGEGQLTIEMGGGEIHAQTQLAQLNGGAGVQRGSFRITDGAGRSAVIDLSSAFSLDDVLRRMNTSLDVSVKAEMDGNRLVLTDLSGGAGELVVDDLAGGQSAAQLGIAGRSAGSIQGQQIQYIGRNTNLSMLNDGRGIRTSRGVDDVQITAGGQTWTVDLSDATTIGGVMDAISAATEGAVVAEVAPDGTSLQLRNTGGGAIEVIGINGSKATDDLRIAGSGNGTLGGGALLASLGSVLLSSLRGGSGLNTGSISLTDRAGNSATVDLSGATSVSDILKAINGAGTGLRARINDSGNGIQLTDTSGGSGPIVIGDVNSTLAAELGIAGAFDGGVTTIAGANLQRQWLGENTLLSTMNGGRGVAPGSIRITSSVGTSAVIDLSGENIRTLGDVIRAINGRGLGVTASINENGDGLLLTDTAGGGTVMKVEDVGGRTAGDLRIRGEAVDGRINGSYEVTIDISATDTLTDVQNRINELGFGISAAIINDGSSATPFRLSLTARNTGLNGRFTFDAGTTGLGAKNLVEAQDAAVFFGGAGAAEPLVLTSGTNQLTNVIRGVTLNLNGTSTGPVTINVTENVDNVVGELEKFAEGFNALVDKIQELTSFNQENNKRGLLLGHGAIQRIEREMAGILQAVVPGAGTFRIFSQLGMRAGEKGKLDFDPDRFREAWATDPEAVRNFFMLAEKGMGTVIESRINRLIDPVTGIIPQENRLLDQRGTQFQNRIDQLDKLLDNKRARLERQFASLESVLANLQSQQQSISQMTLIQPYRPRND